jgi:diguanylate cyclase (GGDEF)-like protein
MNRGQAAAGAPVPALAAPAQRRARLLIVDDQPINIQTLYKVFATDCQVLMATSGAKALALCRDDPPDLVLLDVEMPEMDGYQVCERLKADQATRDIPVIFVTAHSDIAAETRGLELGAVDFIAKPISPPVVRARVGTHLKLKAQSDLLRQMAFIDGMTGVYNRRWFNDRLIAEWGGAARSGAALALLMIDVDFFKRFNDHYGHQAGDDCLIRVAAALKAGLHRAVDLVARYGGEEFACILPATELAGAMKVANRLEQQVRALGIEHALSDVAKSVTISVGAAATTNCHQGGPEALLGLADNQLYRAKQDGRGRALGESFDRPGGAASAAPTAPGQGAPPT